MESKGKDFLEDQQTGVKSVWQNRLKLGVILSLTCIAILFCASSLLPFEIIRGFLDSMSGDGSADPYTASLHAKVINFFRMAGLGNLSLAMLVGFISVDRWGNLFYHLQIQQRIKSSLRWWRVLTHQQAGWILGLLIVAFLLRLPYLNDPIRYDEAHTYLSYAKLPLIAVVSLYNDPNNHVFHSLLVHFSTLFLGNDEWVIRLPAFLAGCLLVPLTFLAGRATGGRTAGIAAGSLIAVSSALIEYSVLGRGYTLLCCFTMINFLLIVRLIRSPGGLEWGLLAVSSALGLWTIPAMVYPNLILWGWLLLNQFLEMDRAGSRSVFILIWSFWVGVVCLLTLALYSPIIITSGLSILSGHGFVKPFSISEYLHQVVHEIGSNSSLLLRDWAWITIGGLVFFLLLGVYYSFKNNRSSCVAAIFAVSGCLLFVVWQRVIPYERVWLFTIPLVSVLIGSGFGHKLKGLTLNARSLMWGGWIVFMVIQPVALQVKNHSIQRSRETAVCPEAREIIDVLKSENWFQESPATLIIAVSPTSAPVVYYALRKGLNLQHFERPDEETIRSAVVVVSHFDEQTITGVLEQLNMSDVSITEHFERWKRMETVTLYRYRE